MLAYAISYLYIGITTNVFEKLSGITIGIGGLALINPTILSVLIFFYLFYNLISEIRTQMLIDSNRRINVKIWTMKFIIGLLIVSIATVVVLL